MKEHREFELLIARIESALAPTGAVVKSPDHFLDIITGEEREVDASIRYRLGSIDLLIIVECRDRVKTEDVTWIEQLATKQRHVGANHTVAVSSTGFSSPALKAAKHHGISTRTIAEVTDADILAWADTLEVEEVNTTFGLGRMMLVYDGTYEGAHIDGAAEQQWKDRGWDAPIFVDLLKGGMVSFADLLSRDLAKGRSPAGKGRSITVTLPPGAAAMFSNDPLAVLARDVPSAGTTTEKTIWLEFGDAEIAVSTTLGTLKVRRVGSEVTMSSSRRPIHPSRVVSYSDEAHSVAEVAEREVSLGGNGKRFVITQHRRLPPAESE